MPEYRIREIMERDGQEYIDTPGYYEEEKGEYEDIFDFYESNAGTEDYDKLEDYFYNYVYDYCYKGIV